MKISGLPSFLQSEERGRFIWFAAVAATFVLAQSVRAEDVDPADEAPPPDVFQAMGNKPDSTAKLRGLRMVPRYRAFLPESVDLSSRMPPPGNQGQIGACTSWATAYAARSYYAHILEKRPLSSANIPSPLYVYQSVSQGSCEGTSFLDNAHVLELGAPSLTAYPYRADCKSRPSATIVDRATDFKVKGISRLNQESLEDLRGELAKGNPVLFDLQIGHGWHITRQDVGVRNGYLIEGNDDETPNLYRPNQYHAMTLVGYDDRRQAFRLINSWGRRWGDRGYAWMSYDFVKHRRLSEALVLEVDPPPVPPPPEPVPPRPVPPRPVPRPHPIDIDKLKCSRVERRLSNGELQMSGFVQSNEDLQLVKDAAKQQGNAIVVNLRVLPFPLCEAAQTLEKPLQADDKPEIDTGGKTNFQAGDVLSFKIRSTQSLRFIYALYFSHDGDVETLTQPSGFVPTQSRPRAEYIFGDGRDGRQKFTVTAPFGEEMILVLASKSPLFDGPLPKSLTEREFLSLLRRQLIYKPDPNLPDRDVSAAIVALKTEAKS